MSIRPQRKDSVTIVHNHPFHESDTRARAIAERIAEGLEDYPVVDESDWSELQLDEAAEWWAQLPVKDRVSICQRFGVSVFAARRDEVPDDPRGGLIEYLSDGC